jgi:cellulose synthase/poly-beta-1,6-N-acetylglucosamine synthase-like glycosyltransferase
MDYFLLVGHNLHKGQGSTNEFENIQFFLFHQIVFVLWQNNSSFILFTMSIIFFKVFISCNGILESYEKKSLSFILCDC